MWFEVTGRELRNALGDALDLEACVVLTRTRDKDQTVVGIELVIDISQCIMEIMFKLRQYLLGVINLSSSLEREEKCYLCILL